MSEPLTAEERLLWAIFGSPHESAHDADCEAEFVSGADEWTDCQCDDRAVVGSTPEGQKDA